MTTSLGWQTLTDMVTEVGELVHDTNSARHSVIKAIINRAYLAVADEFDWPQFIAVDESGIRPKGGGVTVATFESGQAELPLPFNAADISSFELQFQDATKPRIQVVGASELYERAGSSLTTTRRPEIVAVIGNTAQTDKLASEDMLIAACNTNNNDNVRAVRLQYVAGSGGFSGHVTESLTGAFSTGVSTSANARAGWPLTQVVIGAGWNGHLRIEDTSANVISFIRRGTEPVTAGQSPTRVISCPLLRLWPVPDKDYAVTITYRRRPRPLVNDDDAPEIPISAYLVEKASAEILRQQNKPDLGMQHEMEGMRFLKNIHRRHQSRPMVARAMNFNKMSGVFDG